MAYCSKCGTNMEEGRRFCSSCGTSIDSNTAFVQDDVTQNKVMGILAYIGPLVLFPIFAAPNSKFARFHANQGLVLFILEIIYCIIYTIISTVILSISWRFYSVVSLIGLVGLVFLVLSIIGIVNAVNGSSKELPVIGKINILK